MNTIKVCGGLGNQIFQYAFGKVQMQNGIDVQFDLSWFKSKSAQSPLRLYLLDKFNTHVVEATNPSKRNLISEKGFNLDLLRKDGYYFSGYWQYIEYYNSIILELRKELFVNKELYTKEFVDLREKIIMDDESVSIHVRRGDYLYLTGFPVMSLNYYQKALEKVKGNLYVFSDDMYWCTENFKNVQFIHLNEYFDFELMRLCKHNIISRSSYSLLAAHLNNNPFKIVVAPKEQLKCSVRKESEYNKSELFNPSNWILC